MRAIMSIKINGALMWLTPQQLMREGLLDQVSLLALQIQGLIILILKSVLAGFLQIVISLIQITRQIPGNKDMEPWLPR